MKNTLQQDSRHKVKEDYWEQLKNELGVKVDPPLREVLNQMETGNMEKWKRDMRAYALVEKDKYQEEKAKKLESTKRAYIPSTPTTKRNRSNRGTLERRLQLVEFVIGKQITMRHAHERSFKGRKSIRWEKMCKAWNEAHKKHPGDLRSEKQLQDDFNNAIRDEHVRRKYFYEVEQERQKFNMEIITKWINTMNMNHLNDEESEYEAFLEAFESLADSKEGNDVFNIQMPKHKMSAKVWKNADELNRAVEDDKRRRFNIILDLPHRTKKDVEETKR